MVACVTVVVCSLLWPAAVIAGEVGTSVSPLQRAKIYLQAGDYRRAVEACQEEVDTRPSAAAYVYLTYVYLALDGYLDHLAKTDQWVAVELLYLNLASGGADDLTDPPDVLARIAKEVVQQASQRQADIAAAMAKRLDEATVLRLWQQQTAWRQANATAWWFGVPPDWSW
jgi:hypothetical protein